MSDTYDYPFKGTKDDNLYIEIVHIDIPDHQVCRPILDIIIREHKVKEFSYALLDLLPAHAKQTTEELIFAILTLTDNQLCTAARNAMLSPEFLENCKRRGRRI